jgi:hypothetical protein
LRHGLAVHEKDLEFASHSELKDLRQAAMLSHHARKASESFISNSNKLYVPDEFSKRIEFGSRNAELPEKSGKR